MCVCVCVGVDLSCLTCSKEAKAWKKPDTLLQGEMVLVG